jgi:hypothetical protein
MMRKISAVLVILIGVCFSCEKKETQKYAGEIILSSELLASDPSWSFYGFTFEDGQIKLYPAATSVRPDLSVTYNDFNQEIALESSELEDAFYKNGDFPSSAAAENFFNTYGEVTALDFQPLALQVEVNQVWTVQTASKKFAKIWIKDSQVKTGTNSDYVELTIRYQYQPDGTKTFPQ